jgi:hypothetical protein
MVTFASLCIKALLGLGRSQPRLVIILSVMGFLGFMLHEYAIAAYLSVPAFRGFTLMSCLALGVIVWVCRHEFPSLAPTHTPSEKVPDSVSEKQA